MRYLISSRFVLWACLALCVPLGFSGCGGSDNSNGTDGNANGESNGSDPAGAANMAPAGGGADNGPAPDMGMMMGEMADPDANAEEDDPAMLGTAGIPEGYAGAEGAAPEGEPGLEMIPGASGTPGAGPQKPSRPQNVKEWTPEQIADAISEGDEKAIAAIDHFAKTAKKTAEEVAQWSTWLAALNKKSSNQAGFAGEPGGEGYSPEGPAFGAAGPEMIAGAGGGPMPSGGGSSPAKVRIAQALLNRLMENGTPAAYLELQKVMSGELELGIPQPQILQWSIAALMKSAATPGSPARNLLLSALTQDTGQDSASAEAPASLQTQAREWHLAFLIAAMNGLLGVETPSTVQGNALQGGMAGMASTENYGQFNGAEMPNPDFGGNPVPGNPIPGQPGAGGPSLQQGRPQARPLQIPHVSLSRQEAIAMLDYLWSPQIVDYAAKRLSQNPGSTDALLMAAALPFEPARSRVRAVLQSQKRKPPTRWLQENVFQDLLADPAIHVMIKSFEREQRPNANPGSGGGEAYPNSGAGTPQRRRPSRRGNRELDPDKLALQEAKYGWMDASEQSLVSLLERMYQGALSRNAVAVDADQLPLDLHPGAIVTVSHQFTLPGQGASPILASTDPIVVKYVRIESPHLNERTVQHYRGEVRGEQVVSILGGNGMWLDAPVKMMKSKGQQQSVDVLLSRNNARPTKQRGGNAPNNGFAPEGGFSPENAGLAGGSGGGGGNFVVEILVVEVPESSTPVEGSTVQ